MLSRHHSLHLQVSQATSLFFLLSQLLLESEQEARTKLEHLEEALQKRVLPGTCPSGHGALQEQLAGARAQWEALLEQCRSGHDQASELLARWSRATDTLDEMERWLAAQKARSQDLPLQASAAAKRRQHEALKAGLAYGPRLNSCCRSESLRLA